MTPTSKIIVSYYAKWVGILLAMAAFAAAALTLLATYAFAQEPAAALPSPDMSQPIGSFSQLLLAALAMLIPAVTAGLVWGGKLIAKVIDKHVSNEWAKGALLRLLSEIEVLASLVGTEFQSLVLDAKRPDSEGGEAITQGELRALAQAILAKLAGRYGGWEQLLDLLQRVGFGATPEAAQAAALSHVETAVASRLATNPQGLLAG